MRKIRVRCPRSQDQIVVIDILVRQVDTAVLKVNSVDGRQSDLNITLFAQNLANGRGDIRWRQNRGRHLIEQRLKKVMIRPVEQQKRCRHPGKAFCGIEPGKTAANNDHPGKFVIRQHSLSFACFDL